VSDLCYNQTKNKPFMKKNMGTADRLIRILIAGVIVALYMGHIISGTMAIVLLALSAIFILTSFIGVCPLYLPFGLKTTKNPEKQ